MTLEREQRLWGDALAWGVLAQAAAALTTAVVLFVGVHRLQPTEFGHLALAVSLVMVFSSLAAAVLSQPFTIRFAGASSDEQMGQCARVLAAAARLGAGAFVATLVPWAYMDGAIKVLALAAGTIGIHVVQVALRQYHFAARSARRVLAGDLVCLAVVTAGLALSTEDWNSSAIFAVWIAAVAASVALLLWRTGLGPLAVLALRRREPWLRDNWSLGRALLADTTMVTAYGYSIPWLLAALASVTEAGTYRLSQTVIGPAAIIATGVTVQMLPQMASLRDLDQIRALAVRVSTVLCALNALLAVGIVGTPHRLGDAVLGRAWPATRDVAAVLAIGAACGAASSGALLELRARGEVARLARCRAVVFPLQIVAVVIGAATWGAVGAAAGLACGNLLSAPLWWRAAAWRQQQRPAPSAESV